MYAKILVPLDGSELAQCSLEHVKKMAGEGGGSQVIVLRVVEPLSPSEAVPWVQANYTLADLQKSRLAEAKTYVALAAENLQKAGVSAHGEVVEGWPAEAIIDYAQQNQIDLIVISSHGRSGIARWALGSVADRVLRHSPIPTLLIAAPGCRVANPQILKANP